MIRAGQKFFVALLSYRQLVTGRSWVVGAWELGRSLHGAEKSSFLGRSLPRVCRELLLIILVSVLLF